MKKGGMCERRKRKGREEGRKEEEEGEIWRKGGEKTRGRKRIRGRMEGGKKGGRRKATKEAGRNGEWEWMGEEGGKRGEFKRYLLENTQTVGGDADDAAGRCLPFIPLIMLETSHPLF